ncbi:hypothetical protein FRC01_012392 [Tulasnella sp. 417]|nr:hypothetical protein FRC01_012392 [Tulasnella sp. 417]
MRNVGRGGGLSGTGEEEDHTQPHEYHEPGRSGHGETNRMEEVAEGTGSLTEDRPPTANAEIQALIANLIETPSSADGLAEAKAIYAAQREAARIAIPVLSENYKDQKELLEKGNPERTDHHRYRPIGGEQLSYTDESLKAKISSTGTSVHKKRKTGRTKRGSQAAADGNLRSATADESNSGILATLERLKDLESKTEPKELEEQDKRLGRTEEDVEEGVFEGRAGSQ